MKKNNKITSFVWNAATLLVLLLSCGLTSCLKENEVETSSECAVLTFSVGSIKSYVTVKKYDNKGNATDTVVAKTIAGSDIQFNIDHVKGEINTVDSLPNWVDLTRVVPSFTSNGAVLAKLKFENMDSMYYRIASGSDSIDFSRPVELMCVATDGMSYKHYTVNIHKGSTNIDTLEWKQQDTNLAVEGIVKPFYANGTVFAFAKNAEGKPVVTTCAANGTMWSEAAELSNEKIDYTSVTLLNETFYALDSEGYIYSSSAAEMAKTWTKASEQKVDKLLGADKCYVYALSEGEIIGSTDMNEWTVQGNSDIDQLPESDVNIFSYPSRTNANLYVSVLAGNRADAESGKTWFKMSSLDSTINQDWAYVQLSKDNVYGLPKLGGLSMTYYNGALYAIGTKDGAYKNIYRSEDNGITWHKLSGMYPLPADLDAANGLAALVTVGSDLWIIQENGKVWQGSIR